MEMEGEGNFLTDILLRGDLSAVDGLDDLDFGGTQETQTHEEVPCTRSTKGHRKKNFHYKEDEIVCSGWLNVSKDPINGANQSKSTFWGRVHEYFVEHNKLSTVRSESSVMHRWLTIQLQVNKFCSCYEQILRRNQSGTSIEDKVVEAKKLYVELDKEKKSFGLEHCWKILKGEDKWKSKMIELAELDKIAAKKKTKGSTKEKRPREEEGTEINDLELVGGEESAPKKRPEGVKKAKENLRRGGGEACMEALDKMMAKKEVLDKEKEKAKEERFMASLELEKAALEVEKASLELEKKRVANEEKKAEAKLLKEEREIMLADMSSLNPMQRLWIEKMQKKIMEKDLDN